MISRRSTGRGARRARRRRRLTTLLALCAALALGVGCASTGGKTAYSASELRSEALRRVPTDRKADVAVPFQVSEELVHRARALTSGSNSEYGKANRLLQSITDREGFALHWEPVGTSVATDTVERGHGNCMSLTSLYVGLARALGLSAYYIDASDRVQDVRREQELIVDSGHIAAAVRTERGWSLVDFDGEISDYRTFRIIDDLEALAHYYNNRGYELIHAARSEAREVPWDRVRNSFAMAVSIQPGFARAHNNMGVIHARADDDALAVRAYEAAIEADPDFAAPHHNLANLLSRQGSHAEAIQAYRRAARLQPRNPFVHYHLGLALHREGDVEGAIESFRRSISLKGDYAEPRNILAQIYRQLGQLDEAERVQQLAQRMSGGVRQGQGNG